MVILRLRGRHDLGSTFMDELYCYGEELDAVGSKLVIVSASERLQEQLEVTKVAAVVGAESIYPTDERGGATLRRAHRDALAWVEQRREGDR